MKRPHLLGSVAAITGLVVLTACGGNSAGETSETSSNGLEKTDITVGVLPIADYTAVYWADENGYFEEAGLNVEFEPLQGGPIGVQKVVSGELDFSFSNPISSTIAGEGGAPVTTVVLTASIGDRGIGVYTTPDSELNSIEDLDGATIGINTTNNIGDVTFDNLASSLDLDVQPNWVEVPFNEMLAGVQAGSIDAGYSPEPYISAAYEEGMKQLVDLTEGDNAEFPAATFISSTAFAEEHPNTVQAFADAVYAAGKEMSENEEEFRTWLPEVVDVPAEAAQSMELPIFYSELQLEELQGVMDVLYEQGRVETQYDAADLTFTP